MGVPGPLVPPHVCIDLDPAAGENIDEFRMMRPREAWLLEDASIDLALATMCSSMSTIRGCSSPSAEA